MPPSPMVDVSLLNIFERKNARLTCLNMIHLIEIKLHCLWERYEILFYEVCSRQKIKYADLNKREHSGHKQ